jgi:hypothetical protein
MPVEGLACGKKPARLVLTLRAPRDFIDDPWRPRLRDGHFDQTVAGSASYRPQPRRITPGDDVAGFSGIGRLAVLIELKAKGAC